MPSQGQDESEVNAIANPDMDDRLVETGAMGLFTVRVSATALCKREHPVGAGWL